jgi:hypothetical protein
VGSQHGEKDSQYLHSEATQPVFTLLADKRYQGANDEFLKAHEHYRHGDHKACLKEARARCTIMGGTTFL